MLVQQKVPRKPRPAGAASNAFVGSFVLVCLTRFTIGDLHFVRGHLTKVVRSSAS